MTRLVVCPGSGLRNSENESTLKIIEGEREKSLNVL
jgi:hypothetical protein